MRELSDAIARAVLATVEADRCCNLGNIREAAFRELAVAEAGKMLNAPVPVAGTAGGDDELFRLAVDLERALYRNVSYNSLPGPAQDAWLKFHDALRKRGVI